ncbi:MAG TPA: hypothetical protein VMJ10_02000 [Kofleriaceae bacterium]|nr:hypothetical protein [Kofleriaceae bacterium]
MSGSPKQKLEAEAREESATSSDEKELYLSDGRRVVVRDQLVEIRSQSGLVEVRIQMTEQGAVLQMEAARMKIAASEAVEIAAPKIAITGNEVEVSGEEEVTVDSNGDVRVVGKMIYLN